MRFCLKTNTIPPSGSWCERGPAAFLFFTAVVEYVVRVMMRNPPKRWWAWRGRAGRQAGPSVLHAREEAKKERNGVKQVAISGSGGRLWAALLEQGRLVEWRSEQAETEPQAGCVYRGRVTDVLPGIQAAFVDIGQGKNAFLYVDDALPPFHGTEKRLINELVRVGETLLVQVSKEAAEGKAPKVTTRVSIPGRLLVYLPPEGRAVGTVENGLPVASVPAEPTARVSVSRKIADEAKRRKLRERAAGLLEDGEGVIVRTEAEHADDEAVARELTFLRKRWREALASAAGRKTPCLICRDVGLIEAALRDFGAEDAEEIIVEETAAFQRVKELTEALYPDAADKIRRYQGREPLFERLGLVAQLDRALQRRIPLPSGVHLVFDRTEAMTVIDVNTGAFSGKGGQQREQAITAANLEAAREIARQLRLRDIGGIVLIDFVNMQEAANRERVLAALRAEAAKDTAPVAVLGMTALGLVELTRKRVRASLAERMTEPCPCCGGTGRVLSVDELERRLFDELGGLVRSQEAEAALIEVPARMYERLAADSPEGRPLHLYVLRADHLPPERYRILYAGRREEADRLYREKA
jgi:ribonuclease G